MSVPAEAYRRSLKAYFAAPPVAPVKAEVLTRTGVAEESMRRAVAAFARCCNLADLELAYVRAFGCTSCTCRFEGTTCDCFCHGGQR